MDDLRSRLDVLRAPLSASLIVDPKEMLVISVSMLLSSSFTSYVEFISVPSRHMLTERSENQRGDW